MRRRAVCSDARPSVSRRAPRAPGQAPPRARCVRRGACLPRCLRRVLGRGAQDLPRVCRGVSFVHWGASRTVVAATCSA
eukprot:4579636-Pyramimonas_sp.AAC.1